MPWILHNLAQTRRVCLGPHRLATVPAPNTRILVQRPAARFEHELILGFFGISTGNIDVPVKAADMAGSCANAKLGIGRCEAGCKRSAIALGKPLPRSFNLTG